MKRPAFALLLLTAIASVLGSGPASEDVTAAQEDAVSLVHVRPDGGDFTGNPFCPDTVWDNGVPITVNPAYDCNNIVGQNHVIRTDGWNVSYTVDGWNIQNSSGATAVILVQGRCGDLPEVTERAGWNPANDDEQCVVIRSTAPGETGVTLTYIADTITYVTDAVAKGWDSLVDTVILKSGPADEDVDGDIDADDHHLADQQGTWEDDAAIYDPALHRLRSAGGPIRLVEIVHGEHDALIDGEVITLHHPTEGAVILATIDSEMGCTYFTDQLGVQDFGTAMNGISDASGRFVGPQVAPSVTQPPDLTMYPDSHNGTSAQGDYDITDVWLDTVCEEEATITFQSGYRGVVGSLPLPTDEWIRINWVTTESAKQPVTRWAGDDIVLEKRWALPDDWFPNGDADGDTLITAPEDVCPLASQYDTDGDTDVDVDDLEAQGRLVDGDGDTAPDTIIDLDVRYERQPSSPGGLMGAYVDADEDGYLDSLNGSGSPDEAVGDIDIQCHSKGLYESENPGQVDVQALVMVTEEYCSEPLEFPGGIPLCPGTTTVDEYLINQHAFLVWYLKIYQVKLTNVVGARTQHNAGVWQGTITDTGTDSEEDTLNVSADNLLRVQVKGWFHGGDASARGDVCVDIDGDGDGLGSPPGEPYPTSNGCADVDDELVAAGHWVLPDDLVALAGPDPGSRIPTWDVMSDIDEAASALSGSGFYVGPKATIDSHDNVVRPNMPCSQPYCGRKTVDPDGELTEADAIMPVLKIAAQIADPADAGFLKQALKLDDLDLTSLFQSYMIPYEPEIPPVVMNGGYDWDSWACGLQHIDNTLDCPSPRSNFGPYEFYRVFSILPGVGPLENTGIGNQDGQSADDPSHPRVIQFYTDNRGWAFFFVNGDYNLDFGDCPLNPVSGAPDCTRADVVGTSAVTVIGDYPYFRKHPTVASNPVVKTWIWDGSKVVTAEIIDSTHTAVIAHLKDRDGYCKFDVDVDSTIDVLFSPSEHPLQGEEVEFIVNSEVGSIVDVSANALYSAPHVPLGAATVTGTEDGVIIGSSQAVARAEDARVLEGLELLGMVGTGSRAPTEQDECQAWIVIEHPVDEYPDVSIYFQDPEGTIIRHWSAPAPVGGIALLPDTSDSSRSYYMALASLAAAALATLAAGAWYVRRRRLG
jgi:hypothetical protein